MQAPHRDGAGAAFFQRRVIEERIGIGVQNGVAEGRWLARVLGDQANAAAFDARQHRFPTVDIHRFVQAIEHGLRDERMIGQRHFRRPVLEASGLEREHRRQKIVGLKSLERRRCFFSAAETQHGESACHVPAPAHAEHRRGQQRLNQHLFGVIGAQQREHLFEGKTMCWGPRERLMPLSSALACNSKIERPAKTFAKRQSPRAVDAHAEGRVNHKLHAARFVEETFEQNFILRRHHADRAAFCAATYATTCSAIRPSTPHSVLSHSSAAAGPLSSCASDKFFRSCDSSADSSRVPAPALRPTKTARSRARLPRPAR